MSCLFESIGYFIGESGNDIRKRVCDYLEQNKPIVKGVDTNKIIEYKNDSVINYIIQMRSKSTMGSVIEIQAACNIWKISIIVHNNIDLDNNVIQFIPMNKLYDQTIDIFWTGSNYEPIKK